MNHGCRDWACTDAQISQKEQQYEMMCLPVETYTTTCEVFLPKTVSPESDQVSRASYTFTKTERSEASVNLYPGDAISKLQAVGNSIVQRFFFVIV